jgi:hypothetical protein
MSRWWKNQPEHEVLTDFFSEQLVRVWLVLDADNDLSVEAAGEDEIGERPEWLTCELANLGWADIADIEHFTYTSKDVDGNEWNEGQMLWALQNGIAPGQAFLVEMDHPNYTKDYNYEYGTYEYDVEFSSAVIRVEKWTEKQVLNAWEQELKGMLEYRVAEVARRKRLQAKRRTDVKSMYLCSDIYFTSRYGYDEMSVPDGVRYRLCTDAVLRKDDYKHAAELAWGEDPKGNWESALTALVENAKKTLPHLTEKQIRALPKRHRY